MKLVKVGIFYDGSYFAHVSNYYRRFHPQKRHINVGGLHEYIAQEIAERESTKANLCQIIDAHFFRGRFSAKETSERPKQLFYDRVFDEVMMRHRVQLHYLPIKDFNGQKHEKGIDVMMALETFDLARLKLFDVVVLVASDGDYVPLVTKLHSLGCKTMLLGWDYEYHHEEKDEIQVTKTSTELWNTVSYPLEMSTIINEGIKGGDEIIEDMFVSNMPTSETPEAPLYNPGNRQTGEIMKLGNGTGFIKFPNNNVFFHHTDLRSINFNDLEVGDMLEFEIFLNNRDQQQARDINRAPVLKSV